MQIQPEDLDSKLATLLQLGSRARAVQSRAELRFLVLNETISLISYTQSVLWMERGGVEGVSGVSSLDLTSPYCQWLDKWFPKSPDSERALAYQTDLRLLEKEDQSWSEWLPPHVVTLILPKQAHFSGGKMLFARQAPFQQNELLLLQEWAEMWSHEYARHIKSSHHALFHHPSWGKLRQYRWPVSALLLLLVSLIPVSQSILAPAELIPNHPSIVRSPMDGIIRVIDVASNQSITQGQPLFRFDTDVITNQLEVAKQALATTEAEFRALSQRALVDTRSKAQLSVVKSRIDEKQIEVEHLTALLARSEVKADRDGLALFSDDGEWVGKPVRTGERIMMIADQHDVLVEVWISPKDVIPLKKESSVRLFLSANPTQAIKASIDYVAYLPELRPEGVYAYRARAKIDSEQAHHVQVGLKGTARLEGESVPLWYWIARKPWAALRTGLGV